MEYLDPKEKVDLFVSQLSTNDATKVKPLVGTAGLIRNTNHKITIHKYNLDLFLMYNFELL